MFLRVARFALAICPLLSVVSAQSPPAAPPLIGILDAELARNFALLSKQSEPPVYYIAYSVTAEESGSISASFGSIVTDTRSRQRLGECSLRVGTPEFDNFHVVDGDRQSYTSATSLPEEDDAATIRVDFWRLTDASQRIAVQRFQQVQSAVKNKQAPARATADFSVEPPRTAVLAVPALKVNAEEWKTRLRRLSLLSRDAPAAINSSLTLSWRREIKTLVNSEGTRLQHGRTFAMLSIVARGKAADGEDLVALESFDARGFLRACPRTMCCAPPSRRPWPRSRNCATPRRPTRSSARRFSPAAPPASSFTRSSVTASKAIANPTCRKARRFPTASARAFCRISSASSSTRRCTTPPARISTAGTASTTKEFQRAA